MDSETFSSLSNFTFELMTPHNSSVPHTETHTLFLFYFRSTQLIPWLHNLTLTIINKHLILIFTTTVIWIKANYELQNDQVSQKQKYFSKIMSPQESCQHVSPLLLHNFFSTITYSKFSCALYYTVIYTLLSKYTPYHLWPLECTFYNWWQVNAANAPPKYDKSNQVKTSIKKKKKRPDYRIANAVL